MKCALCEDCRWVCEQHLDRPWEGEHACGCDAAGAPCPRCNASDDEDDPPRLLKGHKSKIIYLGFVCSMFLRPIPAGLMLRSLD
jgi:hypothetical protein